MSKNNVVRKRNTEAGSDNESAETVDLGIGISVALDVDPAAVDATDLDPDTDADTGPEPDGSIELAFDEREMIEAADDGNETAVDNRSRLEADERTALEAVGIEPDAVPEKEYSYRMLLDAGLDEAAAGTLRRRFSLPWSFETGGDGDLDRRSDEVRGLGAAEREWIAVSADEDWQAFEYETSPVAAVGREKPSERPWPKPTPVTAVTGVGPDDADELAEAGIRSAERLATISAFEVASVLDLNVLHVRTWRHNARELLD
ncbi:hypothetical protein GS429_19275 [Natronorubrum sp. JWXQ-INN-674]|uniref:Helix-hairpin-helix domain-containing protein n=1 Tax=Natronorubrum halalkaliphilum TaxID=2691917 RepID=A0A6B0VSW8_9EURY|nr:hypothetical protein [Natronorubrum halalkaliphilum]MXV64167.1 hypothetical protein [Natronorubrum halalkaliphilum]